MKHLRSALSHPKSIGGERAFWRLWEERAEPPDFHRLFWDAVHNWHTHVAARLVDLMPGYPRGWIFNAGIISSCIQIKKRRAAALYDLAWESTRLPPEMMLRIVAVAARAREERPVLIK